MERKCKNNNFKSLKITHQNPSSIRGSIRKELMKKLKYQITKRQFIQITVNSFEEEQCIKTLNKMFYNSKDKDYFYRKNVLSLNMLQESGYEAKDNTLQFKIITKNINEVLYMALDELTDKQKQVIYYLYFKDCGSSEVALILNTSIQNVNQTKLRALKKLKELLENKYKFFD